MRKIFNLSSVLVTISLISKVFAEPDPNFHIYLAFGQSNMEGNADIEKQDLTVDKRFQMLSTTNNYNNNRKLGQWYDAIPPLANPNGKLGPVDYFGRTLVEKLPEPIRVGAVVVAVAGCDIQLFEKDNYKNYKKPDWMEGIVAYYDGNPYGRLIEMAKKAQEVGVIKGILLHQGETNNTQQDWPLRVKGIYENILKDLNLKAEEVPLLVGELARKELGGTCGDHNAVIAKVPEVIPTAHVISSANLKQRGDGFHFTAESYRIFGARYAEKMLSLLGDINVEKDKENETCWSVKLGYPCCVETTDVITIDDDGKWGIENDEWCGIPKSSELSECWAEALGYKCCSTTECKHVFETDDDGQWSVEDDQWCGITSANCISE